MRITARRNSRSFAAPQKIPAAKQRLPAAVPSPHSAAAFPHASALCIRPSHSLPALKIPLKIDPLCFMPAPDCAPQAARWNRAPFRGLSTHFKRHGKRPVFTKSRPLPNAENDRRCRLRPPSPKFCRFTFAPPRCTGRKISRHFPLPPENKSHPFLFLPIGRGLRPFFLRIFPALRTNFPGRHLLPVNGRPASPRLCRDGFRRHPPPRTLPAKKTARPYFLRPPKNRHKKNAPHDETRSLFFIQQDQSRAALTMRSSSRIARSSGVRRITAAVGTPSASRRSFSFFVSSSISSLER